MLHSILVYCLGVVLLILRTYIHLSSSTLPWTHFSYLGRLSRTNVQCGFRSRRSTVDHLVRFEVFIHNQHLISVFFDLEKAYDTTWKYGIMKDLHGFGLRGHLPNFIANFLKDRSFKVWVGSTFSDSHLQDMGVPQGSILSVTLFSVNINSIAQCLKTGVDCSLYVDDFQICYRSSNMSIIERQLQLSLNKLQQWATDNGFRFSKTKTLYMHICQKRGHHLDPQHFLDKSPIPVVKVTRFLGVLFDRKLSFIPHLKYVKKKSLKALNIFKVIGNTEWGAGRNKFLTHPCRRQPLKILFFFLHTCVGDYYCGSDLMMTSDPVFIHKTMY